MSLELSDQSKQAIQDLIARYPKKEAALLPVLHLAQNEIGFISSSTEEVIAKMLEISPVKVHEVVTFYSMYNREEIGKYHIQICANLSCTLLGGDLLMDYLIEKLGIKPGETTEDKKFTLSTVQCLGACETAPCMMVNFDYFGNLDKDKIDEILDKLE